MIFVDTPCFWKNFHMLVSHIYFWGVKKLLINTFSRQAGKCDFFHHLTHNMKISQAKTVESGNGPWGWIFLVFSVCCDYISFLYFTVWVRSSHCMSCLWILSKIRQLLQTEQNSAPSLKPKHRHTKRYNAIKKGSCNFWSFGVEKTRYVKTKIGAGYELSVLRWAQ